MDHHVTSVSGQDGHRKSKGILFRLKVARQTGTKHTGVCVHAPQLKDRNATAFH